MTRKQAPPKASQKTQKPDTTVQTTSELSVCITSSFTHRVIHDYTITRAATCKVEQSASKFHKSQIRKFADLYYLLYLLYFFVICEFVIGGFSIYGLKTSASPKIHTFSPYKYSIKCSNSKLQKIFFISRRLGLL